MSDEQAERLIQAVDRLGDMPGWTNFTIIVIGGWSLIVWLAR